MELGANSYVFGIGGIGICTTPGSEKESVEKKQEKVRKGRRANLSDDITAFITSVVDCSIS